MAYGKNKGLNKRKGGKKKVADPFLKKVWYDFKAPTMFAGAKRKCGKTCVTKTAGNKTETQGLMNRVAEFNLADLHDQPEDNYKKIKLEVQDIQGKNCITDFHAMSLDREKMCKLIKKKHTLIQAFADCKTTDGYVVRLFTIALTQRYKDTQVKNFCYAQTAQIRRIRKRMVQIMQAEVGKGQLRDVVKSLIVNKIEGLMKTQTNRIFPLDPVHIFKVKILKKPKIDISKLMEIHEKGGDDEGVAVATDEAEEAKNLLA